MIERRYLNLMEFFGQKVNFINYYDENENVIKELKNAYEILISFPDLGHITYITQKNGYTIKHKTMFMVNDELDAFNLGGKRNYEPISMFYEETNFENVFKKSLLFAKDNNDNTKKFFGILLKKLPKISGKIPRFGEDEDEDELNEIINQFQLL